MTSEKVNELNELAKQLENQYSAEPKSFFYYAETYCKASPNIPVPVSGVVERNEKPRVVFKEIHDHLAGIAKVKFNIAEDEIVVIIKQFNTL